jgi:DNA-binding winged helix-turn-helix (wHTH) protein/tetratricopeptide (TPR) repeat protein
MTHNDLRYEFGPYQLDPSKRILTRNGEGIPLTPKATDILLVLVKYAGQLVEKDELLKEVWPDTFVEEANLSQNIFTLRRALRDDRADPKYIETIARRGYRFIESVKTLGVNGHEFGDSAESADQAGRRPVVVVLPFTNTGDVELDYLVDGLTHYVINNLSRVSQLRVMSHSAAFRYKTMRHDPQRVGKELNASAVLVGNIDAGRNRIACNVELVDVGGGWQLWGQTFDSESKDLLEIQESIIRHLVAALKLRLTGVEEKKISARYTENLAAYQAYLEGRYHWSRYTREGIEKAIYHFGHAIKLDPNYALAYAATVDCYLRLTTNYLPPEEDGRAIARLANNESDQIELRFEWDCRSVERELRRAADLKADYTSPHQWDFVYRISKQLYEQPFSEPSTEMNRDSCLATQMRSVQLTPTEEVQILCSVARDQITIGNFEAARLILARWAIPRKWPKLASLNPYAAADLLFTLGTLFGSVAGTTQVVHGHKQAEALLNGSIALFAQLGLASRSSEARIELARCYYKQGLFDLGRETLSEALFELPDDQIEIKSFGLLVWGAIERESGRLKDSLIKLRQAASLEGTGPLAAGRCYHELATTLKELANADHDEQYSDEAAIHFQRAIYRFEAVGHHRYVAAIENNMGFLLLSLGRFKDSEQCLLRAKRLFESLGDCIHGAQTNETLARLYIETKQFPLAEEAIHRAVKTLEKTDGEASLAESLRTAGVVAARQQLYDEAKKSFEAAFRVSERCGDHEGARRALRMMFEELNNGLDPKERNEISDKLNQLSH